LVSRKPHQPVATGTASGGVFDLSSGEPMPLDRDAPPFSSLLTSTGAPLDGRRPARTPPAAARLPEHYAREDLVSLRLRGVGQVSWWIAGGRSCTLVRPGDFDLITAGVPRQAHWDHEYEALLLALEPSWPTERGQAFPKFCEMLGQVTKGRRRGHALDDMAICGCPRRHDGRFGNARQPSPWPTSVVERTIGSPHIYNFRNRVLLLTGASGGIGRAISRLFFANGAKLVLADLDEGALAELGGSLDSSGQRVATLRMDAAKPEDADAVLALTRDRFGGVDFLVPSAGLYLDQPVSTMTDEQWRQTIGINLDGIFYICRRAIPMLRDESAIVNLTSIAAHRGSFHHAHYAASKGGVLSLTRSLALELGPRTRANAVSPGIIETPMTAGLIRERGAQTIEQTALKRFGRADEIASVIAFLCSDAASFITGEVIHVNGGLYMAG
jgi:3-oxoacyl-[acyl-carrier protein] reductase